MEIMNTQTEAQDPDQVTEDAEEPEHPKKSAVWRFFTKLDACTAECTTCAKKLKTKNGNTSALKRHSEKVHKLSIVSVPESNQNDGQIGDGIIRRPIFLEKTSERATALTSAIAAMIAKDLHPYSVVGDEGFKNLMRIAEPRYEIPHRTTFSRQIIPELYNSELQKVRDVILSDMNKGVRTLAFSSDGWTSRAVDHFMSLTIHYVSTDYTIRHFMLNVRYFPASHTANNLRCFFKELLREWGLDEIERNIYFVTDNARNIVKAIEDEESWCRIPCFAHTLQLAVKDVTRKCPALVQLCKRCRQIVGFFSRSAKGRTAFIDAQKQLNPERVTLNLIQDVDTRWNSQYDMLERLLKLRVPLSIVLCERSMPENLTNGEWTMLESFVNVLGPLKEATQIMSGDEYPTISYYVPVVLGLMSAAKENISRDETQTQSDQHEIAYDSAAKNTEIQVTDDEESEAENSMVGNKETEEREIRALATHLYEALDHRFNGIIGRSCFIIAMLLDPRFKDRLCSTAQQKKHNHEVLRSAILALTSTEVDCENSIPFDRRHDNEGQPVSKLRKFLENIFIEENEENMSYESKIDREIDMYFRERVVPPNTSILTWWKQSASRYPTLATIATDYLAIPATQVSSERLFSTAGNIATSTRATLLTEHVEELCFLQKNLNLKDNKS